MLKKQEPKPLPLALRWGLFTGTGIIITHILLHQAGLLPCTLWVYSDFVLLIGGVILAQTVFKRRNEGFISVKCGFVLGAMLSLFADVFSRFYLWLELQFIDDGLIAHFCEEFEKDLVLQGFHVEEISMLLENEGPTVWGFISGNFLLFVTVGIALSLVLSWVMRNDPPPTLIVYDHVEREKS